MTGLFASPSPRAVLREARTSRTQTKNVPKKSTAEAALVVCVTDLEHESAEVEKWIDKSKAKLTGVFEDSIEQVQQT